MGPSQLHQYPPSGTTTRASTRCRKRAGGIGTCIRPPSQTLPPPAESYSPMEGLFEQHQAHHAVEDQHRDLVHKRYAKIQQY